jgi:hypothetical protein
VTRSAAAATSWLAIALCATATAARADSETSASFGAGLAYEVLGFDIAHRVDHVEGYVAVGVGTLLPGIAAGARWYLHEDGEGFFVGLNTAFHGDTLRLEESTGGRLVWATITPGMRFNFGTAFFQLAAGGGVIYSLTFWRTPPSPTKWVSFFPDAALAIGLRFF